MDERLERKAEGEFLIVVADQSRDKTRQLERGRKQRSRVWYNDSAQFLSFFLLAWDAVSVSVGAGADADKGNNGDGRLLYCAQSINQSINQFSQVRPVWKVPKVPERPPIQFS